MNRAVLKTFMAVLALSFLTSCGSGFNLGRVKIGSASEDQVNLPSRSAREIAEEGEGRTTIWDAFRRKNTESKIQVNRYLWSASLDVLNFMPVQSIDPFSGVIVFGYGTPPGGGRSYRATVHINDPALDARSLNVALSSRGGPVASGTQRAVESAILNRARQLRIKDRKF